MKKNKTKVHYNIEILIDNDWISLDLEIYNHSAALNTKNILNTIHKDVRVLRIVTKEMVEEVSVYVR